MAVLVDANRVTAYCEWMEDNRQPISIVKADLRAAINAADVWLDTNAAAFNLALPLAARTNFTPKQKALLLVAVIKARFNVA